MNTTQKKIIQAAIRAPSGDNCQPWWFKFTENGQLNIGIDPQRAESFFDYKLRGTLLSLGAVIENIRVQAAKEHLQIRETEHHLDEGEFDKPFVTIEFASDKNIAITDSYITAMQTRTVNRRPFLPFALKSSVTQWMLDNQQNDVQVHVYNTRKEIKKWANVIYLADSIRYSHPVIHENVFSKILLSKKEALNKRLGLEINRLGAGPLAGLIIRLIKPWKRIQKLSKFGADRALAHQSEFTALMTGAMVLITIPSNSPKDWLNAGKTVERLWTTAQEKKLCIHPMCVALYLDARFQDEAETSFLPAHLPLLEDIQGKLKDFIPEDRQGAMLFRVGYGWRMSTPAIRLQEDKFIKN